MFTASCRPTAWLDSLAAGLSLLCAIHCLVMPVLMVALPILATSFLADANFHLWMLLLVVPFTTTALFLGCRKHRDQLVMACGATGLILLSSVAIHESWAAANAERGEGPACPHCAPAVETSWWEPVLLLNLVGGLCLIGGHIRNFHLCRKGNAPAFSSELTPGTADRGCCS